MSEESLNKDSVLQGVRGSGEAVWGKMEHEQELEKKLSEILDQVWGSRDREQTPDQAAMGVVVNFLKRQGWDEADKMSGIKMTIKTILEEYTVLGFEKEAVDRLKQVWEIDREGVGISDRDWDPFEEIESEKREENG